MSKEYDNGLPGGKHIDLRLRYRIEAAVHRNARLPKKDRLSQNKLADFLHIPRSTFSRELKRGRTTNVYKDQTIIVYSAEKAQLDAADKASNKGCPMKITNKLAVALAYLIEEEHLSPYCALMRLKEQGWENLPCPRTIYNHLEYGDLHIDRTKLPYKPRGQKSKPKSPPLRARKNPGNISIEERPESVATREEFGHWEMDTIVSCVGGRGGVLILVERQTRFAVTAKLNRLTKHDVLHALKKVRGEMKAIRSVTTDNGSEFADGKAIARALGNPDLPVYYTHAYSAWEKGTVENTNRIFRRLYPKGTNFRHVNASAIARATDWMNSLHRQKLNDISPKQAFFLAA